MKFKTPRQPILSDDAIARRLAVEIERFIEGNRLAHCPRKACKRAGVCRAARVTDCPAHKA